MNLISDYVGQSCELLTEEVNGKKNVFIEGIFAQADIQNRNKRIYPRMILESAVNEYDQAYIKTGRAFGELEHPSGIKINPDRISHLITELKWNGSDCYGKAIVTDTPCGQTVKALMEVGGKVGVSTRGVGTVSKKNGQTYVNDDFKMATVDIVLDPSAPSAFVNGIMEGVEYFYQGNAIVEQAAQTAKKKIQKLPLKQIAERQVQIFSEFLKEIRG
jgi:hypothetical protein